MFENIILAFQSVWSHKLRSLLTMLGIVIGIASIITIVSTIKGTNEQIKESLVGAGSNAVIIRLCQNGNEYDTQMSSPDGVTQVSEETRRQLLEIDKVLNASVFLKRSYVYDVYYGNNSFNGNLLGIDEHYLSTCGFSLRAGRLFTERDYKTCAKVCLLDSGATAVLYSGNNPVNSTIEVMGESLTVVGVVDTDSSFEAEINSVNDYYTFYSSTKGSIFVPSDTWPVLFRFDEPYKVALKASSTDDMTIIGQKAADILNENHVNATAKENKYSYRGEDLMEQAQQLQQLSNSSNKQLLWIAGISLLVGGIGVMNIMLVTVTERTQEIGLKKALGARKRRILRQFLTEAGVLTGLGGLLGVSAGIGLSKLISGVLGTPTALSVPSIIIALLFSTFIGIVFGLLPAIKASRLDPIAALRRE